MRNLKKISQNIIKDTLKNKHNFCSDNQTGRDVELFSKLDIRIGNIIQCWKHPQSENLYCQKIKIRNQPQIIRQIGSGLQKFVPIQRMTGNVLILANLKPKKLGGFPSQGMVLCAVSNQSEKQKKIEPLFVEGGIVGQRAYVEGYQNLFPSQQILKHLNPKKKILQKCLPQFKTDNEGFVEWNNLRLKISTGFIRTQLKNANIS